MDRSQFNMLAICFVLLILGSSAFAIDPPKKLSWGTIVEQVDSVLRAAPKKERLQVKKPNEKKIRRGYREYPRLQFSQSNQSEYPAMG